MVQAIAAEQGAEGLQKWMDKLGWVARCDDVANCASRAPLTHPSRDHT